ncbi:MAG: GreA/GreB family elongation factor [Candidatus Limnocylindrales bacterium]
MPQTPTLARPTTTASAWPSPSMAYPMTRVAWSALRAELARDSLSPTLRPDRELARRLVTIRAVLETGTIADDAGLAVIGRRVTWREPDGLTVTASLVIPGDGDPRHGWISVDAPLGVALLGTRAGDRVVVRAPAGDRTVSIETIA